MKKLNELEQLQQKSTGIIFIKSYPVLNNIKSITPTDRGLIELVLSYQDNEQTFKMSYSKICEILNVKIQTLKNVVNKLKDLGFLTTEHKSNFNGINGGSSTGLIINMKKIISTLNIILQYPQSTKQAEVIQEDQKDIIVAKIEDKPSIKASDIQRQPIQIKKIDIPVPVIENEIDKIDLKKFNIDRLREHYPKFKYEECKIIGMAFYPTLTKLNKYEITFQEMLSECDEILQIKQKEKGII